MVSLTEALLIFVAIIGLSIIVAFIYGRIMRGIVTRSEEREAWRVGKTGYAKEKIVKKR